MATITHDGKEFTIYYDTIKEMKFVMDEKEADRFTQLVRKAGTVEKIDPKELLTGIYLNQKTNAISGIPNDEIVANSVKFFNARGK